MTLRLKVVLALSTLGFSPTDSGLASKASITERTDVPMTRAEQCLAVHEGMGRRARMVELPDHRILLFTNGRFYTSNDGGLSWADSWEPVDSETRGPVEWGEGSLVFFKDGSLGQVGRPVSEGQLLLRQDKLQEARVLLEKERPDSHVMLWRSRDGGRTWSKPRRITPPVGFGLYCVHHVLIRSSSGRLLLPVYGDNKRCYAYYSDDDGETWKASRPVELFVELKGRRTEIDGDEPTVVEVEPGRILMFIRTDMGRLYQSWSLDDGARWESATPTSLAASSAPAQLGKIPGTGDLVVVWSQASAEDIYKGFN